MEGVELYTHDMGSDPQNTLKTVENNPLGQQRRLEGEEGELPASWGLGAAQGLVGWGHWKESSHAGGKASTNGACAPSK